MRNQNHGQPHSGPANAQTSALRYLPVHGLLIGLNDARLEAVSPGPRQGFALPESAELEQLSLPDLLPREEQPEVLECLRKIREGWVPAATQQDFQWTFRRPDLNQGDQPPLMDCAIRPLSTALTGQSSDLALVLLRQAGGGRQSPAVETAGAISKAFQSLELLSEGDVGSYKLDTRVGLNFSVISRKSARQLEFGSITPSLRDGGRSLHSEMLLFHDFLRDEPRGAGLWNRHYLLIPGINEIDAQTLRERVTTFIKPASGQQAKGQEQPRPLIPRSADQAQDENENAREGSPVEPRPTGIPDNEIQSIQDFPFFSIRVETNPFPLLEQALRHDRAEFVYQSIVELSSGRVDRYEALLRLRDAEGQLISPAQFIPPAENHPRLIRLVDRNVSRKAIELLARRPGLRINVNISGPSWVDPTFSSYLFELLRDHPPDLAERLGLEITETALIDDIPEACANIEKLRQRKVLIFLDDFGSSYSSAAYLRDLTVDVVKLDGSFTEKFPESPRSLEIARCLLEAATRCGCRTVVEHISSAQLLDYSKQLNAHYGQGFHLGKLLPERDLPAD